MGKFLFQFDQLIKEAVIFCIGDLGRILVIISFLMVGDLGTERVDACGCRFKCVYHAFFPFTAWDLRGVILSIIIIPQSDSIYKSGP